LGDRAKEIDKQYKQKINELWKKQLETQ
jgi:hypothetical protein